MYKSTKQVNQAFREFASEFGLEVRRGKPQNEQPADTRMAYVDFVDDLARAGGITENLAGKAHYF